MALYSDFEKLMEDALNKYTSGEFESVCLQAQQEYFLLTGKVDPESEEYEGRMKCFNNWYLFNFKESENKTFFEKYCEENESPTYSIQDVRFTLLSFVKIASRGRINLFDHISNTNVLLTEEQAKLSLVPKDLFTGRIVHKNGQNVLLPGVCTLPQNVLNNLRQHIQKKQVRSREEQESFLLYLEFLKTKMLQYPHLKAERIFSFPKP